MNQTAHTAILFFSRTAEAEATHKAVLPNSRRNNSLTIRLINHSLSMIRKTGLAYYFFDQKKQQGETFGEKLHFAFSEIFNLGYQQVIAIGNDCAEMQEYHLLEAFQKLKTTDVVLGNTQVGGIYLLGLTKPAFNLLDFKQMPWQTVVLSSFLNDYFISLGLSSHKLCKLNELTQSVSINYLRPQILKARLNGITTLLHPANSTTIHIDTAFASPELFTAIGFRGPPC